MIVSINMLCADCNVVNRRMLVLNTAGCNYHGIQNCGISQDKGFTYKATKMCHHFRFLDSSKIVILLIEYTVVVSL